MKRSEINKSINEAKEMIEKYSWVLPKWGYWSLKDYDANPSIKKYLKDHQMGWDVTDFGKGQFDKKQNENINEIKVLVDGEIVKIKPRQPLILKRGQSVTVERNIYHKFYAVKGTGMVMAGEVSQVNDDNNDNYFLEPLGRFTDIEENEEAIHPLWNEVK